MLMSIKSLKTPLRYPGGKSKAIKTLSQWYPKIISEYREPFIGGGSIAIDITKSGTRREELIFDKNDLQKMNVLRRIIAPMGSMDAIDFINSKLKNTKNNAEFFNSMNKPV